MRIRFNTYSNKSKALKLLKEELIVRGHDVKELKVSNSTYTPLPGDLIIKWGVSNKYYEGQLNENTRNASNKLTCFQRMVRNGLRWTTNIEEARSFPLCYCRTLLSSSKGRGIIVAQSPAEVVPAPLYTKGIKQVEGEYRVHIFKGQVIDFAKKMKMRTDRLEEEGITLNPLIRNLDNGYVFGREGVTLHEGTIRVAIEAVEDLELDLAAVDVVRSSYSGDSFVLEVNTAPGMEGSTVLKYASAIEGLIG